MKRCPRTKLRSSVFGIAHTVVMSENQTFEIRTNGCSDFWAKLYIFYKMVYASVRNPDICKPTVLECLTSRQDTCDNWFIKFPLRKSYDRQDLIGNI